MLSDLQYFELPAPTNIYGSTTFKHDGRRKLCVAALNQVILIHSNDTLDGNTRWSNIPLSLSNITS